MLKGENGFLFFYFITVELCHESHSKRPHSWDASVLCRQEGQIAVSPKLEPCVPNKKSLVIISV